MSDEKKISNDAYLIKVAVFGNRVVSQNQWYLGGFDIELFDENYYAKAVANIIAEIKGPLMYKWFLFEQIKDVDLQMGCQRTVKWDAFLNANPTTIANEVNTISTIRFSAEVVRLNYLKLQYKFRYLK